ncbi:MAG: hypothetical protein LQ344_007876 [Seirophora lacunosa]|nr:MAG: hypothetical protein LQ344_007876 [Seirophora lacunosa]
MAHRSNIDWPAPPQSDGAGQDVDGLTELPPSIFPCLDARPGRSQRWQSIEIPFKDSLALTAFCSQNHVSSHAVLQAAWALVLRCYIGNPSVCFACSIVEEAAMPSSVDGICKADIDGDLSALELIKGMKTRRFRCLAQSEALAPPPRTLDVHPANTLLLFQESEEQEWQEDDRREAAGWDDNGLVDVRSYSFCRRFHWLTRRPKQAQVVVDINTLGDKLLATINYLPSTLSVVSAQNVASVYAKGIQQMLTHPARKVKDMDLLSPRDLEHLARWNQPFPQKVNACVHDLVLEHAKATPQAPAICSWDGDITYQKLDEMSYQLAQELIKAGVKQETLVPLCFKKSFPAVVAMVAIHRAGGAFVPLDPAHPEDRLKAIIDKAEAKIVVTCPQTAALFRNIPVSIVKVSASMLKPSDALDGSILPTVPPGHAAFVLFTSGSTGKPKGILQEHASVCTSSLAHGRALHVSRDSRVFQYAAFTFDVSMMDIFTTLIYGGCVCIPSEEDRMGSFTSVMNRMRVNWVLFTPSVASLFMPGDVPTLKTLVYGGEAVKQENVSRWVGKVRLFNCYGPAECGACAIGEFTRSDSRPANVGRQFGGELCWVVDPENHDRLLPVGAVGELVVEGPTVARGYLNDLGKTQAAFIKSPAWPKGAASTRPRRVYKTGDLVRQNSDGTFDFVGRKDLQVKVRGQRVEIGEVEHHMCTYPDIALSIVTQPQAGPYAQTLVGILQLVLPPNVLGGGIELDHLSTEQVLASEFDREKLRGYLTSRLPAYMVPTHVLLVTRLPLSVSGKIDRKVVDAWLLRTSRPTEPITPSERLANMLPKDDSIAREICSKVLLMVSEPSSSFFKTLDGTNFLLAAAGLDSIKMISLVMFIRQRFGVTLHLELLTDPKSSIEIIGGYVANSIARGRTMAVKSEIDIMDAFQAYRQKTLDGTLKTGTLVRKNVFLTGATGFLGSRILRQLCRHAHVQRVFVHVRSQNARKALERIVQTALIAGWWTDEDSRKVEVWVGDLAKPKLGVNLGQWNRLCGRGSPEDRVTSIIHNGATVNWNANLLALKATNVDSTVELLKAASESAVLTDFLFVSGGQQLRVEEDDEIAIAEEVAQSNGYAQSKFLSELLVKEYARTIARRQQRVTVFKPGYIIGGAENGICVADDFVWRLTAACAEVKSYNEDDADAWLFISDVDRVAIAIAECSSTYGPDGAACGASTIKVLDGLRVSEFWDLVRQGLGREIRPLSAGAWMKGLHASIGAQGEQHPLWPLLHTLEEGRGRMGAKCSTFPEDVDAGRRVRTAIQKSVEHLQKVGFLSRFKDERSISKNKIDMCVITESPMALA